MLISFFLFKILYKIKKDSSSFSIKNKQKNKQEKEGKHDICFPSFYPTFKNKKAILPNL